jgi:hypothetical protein
MKWKPASEEELARRGIVVTRARTDDGKFQADDPATPDVDEAWAAPKPKRKRKKD